VARVGPTSRLNSRDMHPEIDRANREIIATIVPVSDRSIRQMILWLQVPNSVFLLRVFEDAFSVPTISVSLDLK
jgi:hypothetical protein